MACRMVSAKPLYNQILDFFIGPLRNKLQWNFNRNSYIFIPENAFENVVCKMAAIFFQLQYVKVIKLEVQTIVKD